jgi:hypothetical protein
VMLNRLPMIKCSIHFGYTTWVNDTWSGLSLGIPLFIRVILNGMIF